MNEQERELDLMVAELEQENRLLRARNERMQTELNNAEQQIHELKDLLTVERLAQKDRANILNNYENRINELQKLVDSIVPRLEAACGATAMPPLVIKKLIEENTP
jgi:chromosome segregation ATPase